MFHRHDRVITAMGPGTVVFTRNAPPDYISQCAVSVCLDSKKDRPGYEGTIFGVDRISLIPSDKEMAEQVKITNEIVDELIEEERDFIRDHIEFISIPNGENK